MERFEDFKRNIMIIIENENQIPGEVMNLIMKVFQQVEEIYNQNRCNNSNISEKIEFESKSIRRILNGRISEDIRNEKFQRAMVVMNRMEKYLEEMEQERGKMQEEEMEDSEKDMENKTRNGILEIEGENKKIVSIIMRIVDEALNDIRLSQSRILHNRAMLNVDAIFNIQQQVLEVIKGFRYREQDIVEAFQQNDEKLKNMILKRYEEYIQTSDKEQKKRSEEDKFRDSLKADISLDEQANSAKEFLIREQETNSNKGKLLVDTLPEILL